MSVKKWLWSVAIKKGLKKAIQLLLAVLGTERLQSFGVTVDTAQLTVGVFASLEVLRNYLKFKKGIGWL